MDTLIPAFLRRQRNQRRLTLEMLSAKVGMSPQHLSEIESGKRDPRLSSIERMAEAMKDEVRMILDRISAVTQSSDSFDPATCKLELRIAASDYVCAIVLPALLRRLAQRAPKISVDVVPLGAKLNEELDRGDVDLLIVPSIYSIARYPSKLLFEDEWECVAWDGNSCIDDTLTMAQFLQLEHVVKRENHPSFPPMDERALTHGSISRNVLVRVPHYGLLASCVVGTNRIATIPRRLAAQACQTLPLRRYTCPLDLPKLRELMHWHPMHDVDARHVWLREEIRSVCEVGLSR